MFPFKHCLKSQYLSCCNQIKSFLTSTVPSSERERVKLAAAFYNQPNIEKIARKKSIRLTPYVFLYSGKQHGGAHILKSAQYLQSEITIRVAKRIMDFRSLPFIVGCNPTILGIHEMYINAFNILESFPPIQTHEDEKKYCHVLRELLDDHKDVLSQLAQGFRESRRHVSNLEPIVNFLDTTITSRLGIRMLAQHHLALREDKENFVGVIHLNMNLKEVIQRSWRFVSEMSVHKFGRVPEIKLSGHVNASFPYIEIPLDYILPEILKNAVRATLEAHPETSGPLPPLRLTIASNETDFIIRLSDRGGGIPHNLLPRVMQYSFSTADEETESSADEGIFSNLMENCNPNPVGGPMFG